MIKGYIISYGKPDKPTKETFFFHLEDSMVMCGFYNVDTLEK